MQQYTSSLFSLSTPQQVAHAPHTLSNFSLGSPLHDHAVYVLPPGPSSYSATPVPAARIGYSYASSAQHPLDILSAPQPGLAPPLHKFQPRAHGWPVPAPSVLSMAVSIPPRHSSDSTTSSSGLSSNYRAPGGDGNDSDGERGRAHPPSAPPVAKEGKKRVHNCWMCHKAFDRPSTLKKHLLVHTGEKAFACPSCGRRFGVASNLTRHGKTCSAANPAPAPVHPSASPDGASPSTATASTATAAFARKRKSPSDPDAVPVPQMSSTAIAPASIPAASAPRTKKRARRAPSPVRWVPDSLRAFDLTPLAKGVRVPLDPVRPRGAPSAAGLPYAYEERDSFDENAGPHPYHERGWRGRLPGPGLLGANVANVPAGGQILVF